MKVLHVINSLDTGGAEKLLIDLIPRLQKEHHQVDLLLLNGMRTGFYDCLYNLSNGVIYHLGSSYYNPLYIFKIIPYLRKYDILHVHLFPSQYMVVLAKILSFSSVKLVFTEHNTSNRRLHNKKISWLERFIYRHYHKIICITAEVKEVLVDKLGIAAAKLIVINNGIDLETIHAAKVYDRQSFGFSRDQKLLIMVAGFRHQKDHDTVIRAMRTLPTPYQLIFVGQGERDVELRQLVAELGLTDRVYFLGVRTDVYPLIKMADVAILSSHWEGFGLAAAEAMACGIPTVASNVSGLAQVVANGGILFEKGDVSDLIECIIALENLTYYKQVSVQGMEKAKNYDIQSMVQSTMEVYKEVLNLD